MLSVPLAYLMDSMRTSRVGPCGRRTVSADAPPAAIRAATRAAVRPPDRQTVLVPKGHSPDSSCVIIAHEQRAVPRNEQCHRPPPARPVGDLPSGHEVLGGCRLAILHHHPYDLRSCRYIAVPGAVIRHE